MPHEADFVNVGNEDEAELCIEGFPQYLKKDLVHGLKKSNEMTVTVTVSKEMHVRGDKVTIVNRTEG